MLLSQYEFLYSSLVIKVQSRSRLLTSRAQDVVTSCFLRQGVMHGALEVDSML